VDRLPHHSQKHHGDKATEVAAINRKASKKLARLEKVVTYTGKSAIQ